MDAPRFAVIDATTPQLSLAEAIDAYRRSGADGIGTAEWRVADVSEAAEQVQAAGLTLTGCFLETASILPPLPETTSASEGVPRPDLNTPPSRIDNLVAAMERLAPLHPEFFYILTGPLGDLDIDTANATVADGLRELADAAAGLDAGLVLEVFHPSLAAWSYASTIPSAIALIDEADRPNLAIAADVWHLGLGAEVPEHLRTHARRIVSLHVNDRREPTRSVWDRLLPGDGVADIDGMLRALGEGGFDGWFELEVLSDDGRVEHDFPDSLWHRDPLELVTAGRAQFLELWSAALSPPSA